MKTCENVLCTSRQGGRWNTAIITVTVYAERVEHTFSTRSLRGVVRISRCIPAFESNGYRNRDSLHLSSQQREMQLPLCTSALAHLALLVSLRLTSPARSARWASQVADAPLPLVPNRSPFVNTKCLRHAPRPVSTWRLKGPGPWQPRYGMS